MFRMWGMSKLARAEDVFADLTGIGWFPVQIKVPRRELRQHAQRAALHSGFRVPSIWTKRFRMSIMLLSSEYCFPRVESAGWEGEAEGREPVAFHSAASSCLAVCRLTSPNAGRSPVGLVLVRILRLIEKIELRLRRKTSHKWAVTFIKTLPVILDFDESLQAEWWGQSLYSKR